MKTFRLLFALLLMLMAVSSYSQILPIQVSGNVTDQATAQPIANHQVQVKIYPDSMGGTAGFYSTAITNQNGFYSLTLVYQFTLGVATPIYIGTQDCMGMYVENIQYYTGSQTAFTADFSICNDSIMPPSQCENYISVTGMQGLNVSFVGNMVGTQQATYTWDLGDNNTATGQYVTHSYSQLGIYLVKLQTVTADGCMYESLFQLMLMDTIPPSGCENMITISQLQGLDVDFQGIMLSGQPASYFWDLGDGSTATGEIVSHTYNNYGYYNVTLQTVTPDSCMSNSMFMLVLMDSINTGCEAEFIATLLPNSMTIAFETYTPISAPLEYTWDFGDGTTGSGPSIMHTYSALGTYMVQLFTSNSIGCTSVYTAPVVVFPDSTGTLDINGQVIAMNSIPYGAEVTLFSTDAAGFFYPVQSTYVNQFGFYNFWNISEGTYLILASPAPDSSNTSVFQFLPTFYGDVVFWDQATEIVLGTPQNPYNINLVSLDSIGGGSGFVGGHIIVGGKTMLAGGQEVLLLDETGSPVRVTYTDAQGNFSFASLPYGNYTVSPMITGTTTMPVQVILNSTNPTANVVMTISGHTITGISKYEQNSQIQSIYPNPAVSNISVTVKAQGSVKLQILDATGKVVLTKEQSVSDAEGLITMSVTDLAPGLYFLVIQDKNGNLSSKRFVKN